MLIAITLAAILLAVTFVALRLIGRACLTCNRPVIDCRCPEVDEPHEVDPDFEASVDRGFVQLPVWDPAPVYPRHPEIPKEGS